MALWDKLYDEPGFGIWLANFREIFMDEAANAELSEYIADQIRRRVQRSQGRRREADPARITASACSACRWRRSISRPITATMSIWSISARRRSSAITEKGMRTTEREYEFDIIVYATGFDAITGAYDLIDIRGIGGETLAGKVEARPVDLPRHARPRLSESADADRPAKRARLRPISRAASRTASTGALACCSTCGTTATPAPRRRCEAEERVDRPCPEMYEIMLMRKAKSWFTGYNSNVAGHEKGTIRYFVYNGGTPKFVGIINDVAAKGYQEIEFSSPSRAKVPAAAASASA